MADKEIPYTLLAPGPVALSPQALKELAKPMIHHRTPEFSAILERTLRKLKEVFRTQQPVLILPSTGSGAMQAALTNVLSPGDKVLCVCSGKFGDRWAEMAEAFGYLVTRLNVEWGKVLKIEDIKLSLSRENFKAVTCQYCETSTGVLHDLKKITETINNCSPETLVLVDGITALGATNIAMDEWNLDVVVGGSQKAFMIPPGLSFISLSERAWAMNKTSKTPKYYFDLSKELAANNKSQTRFSSAVSHIRALDVSLDAMLLHGIDHLVAEVNRRAQATRDALTHLGLEFYGESPSPSLTVVLVPNGVDGVNLRNHIEEKYNTTFIGGQDHLKGKIIRIGHIGHLQPDDVIRGVEHLARGLNDLGYPLADGDVNEAVSIARNVLGLP